MKKLKIFIASIFAIILCAFSCVGFGTINQNVASATSVATTYENTEFVGEVESVLNGFVSFTKRTPGSEGEKLAAKFIFAYLSGVSGLLPKQTAHIDGGVQKFTFESIFSGKYENSQNIIFEYKGNPDSKKKIIIGTNYDAIAYDSKTGKEVESQSVTNGASVAFALTLAKALVKNAYKFNAEIVFFGAGESNNAGSDFYTRGITSEEKSNILLMVNFDSLVGDNLYFYTEEVQDDFSNSMSDLAKKINGNVERINTVHLNKTILTEPNEIGLDYVHIAMISDNFSFMKGGIKTISFFAGDYSKNVVLGRREFAGKETIAYTANDNLDYIKEQKGENWLESLASVYELLDEKFCTSNFISELESVQNQTNWFYAIFANQKLVVFLTVVALVVMIVISMLLHFKLTVKAYHANIETEFLNSVVKICENVSEAENFDESIPAEVSKVIAEDIKRDKMIKPDRKEKKDKDK